MFTTLQHHLGEGRPLHPINRMGNQCPNTLLSSGLLFINASY